MRRERVDDIGPLPRPRDISSGHDAGFIATLDATLPKRAPLEVLDAGCGARFPVALTRPASFTGIDISLQSMQRSAHLDRYIAGDIQTYAFESDYDLVVCMNVLEHVRDPRRAVDNLASAVRPGGVLVLGFPNPLSLKGLVTKLTPHWFHVFVLKSLLGYSKAGQPGHAPFPTYLRFALAQGAVAARLRGLGLEIAYLRAFEGNQPLSLRRRSATLFAIYRSLCFLLTLLSLGFLRADRSEILVVAKRNTVANRPQMRDLIADEHVG